MCFKAAPDGACLTNCFAVHAYEDTNEAMKVKKYVNHHIADNMDYYQNKIVFPYIETVGVGSFAKNVRIETSEEMKIFLKSDEALHVYTIIAKS